MKKTTLTALLAGSAVLIAALLVPVFASDEENNADLNALAGKIGKYNNSPVKDKTTVSHHDVTYTVYPLKKGKKDIGAVVRSSATGFAGPIEVMAGFDADGNICGYKVLQQTETDRWGGVVGTWFQPDSKGSIIGMKAGDLKDKKDGGTVDGISNATITTRAFLYALNSAYKVYKGEEPEQQVIQQGRHGGRGGQRGGFEGQRGPGRPNNR